MDLEIIDLIRRTFEDLPDSRKPGNNRKYRIEDAALSAFSVFFTQSPSFLDYQRRMEKLHNRNNAQSIFLISKFLQLKPKNQHIPSRTGFATPS
ncbi:protein of unknown function [Methylotuvimicrobium alcaliphilum 20Z]|uniref:Uncharacterized protein n=1 Tax=Methylotuvimicrobium alcaliphilum (strain DSM 19304 / NCIMB 14124 / VKM B-2133 / 20Z) TaxID=1091494 RepID=G4T413_META2|nr:protein of unknown function [Methylotuvimicrobium alcaliphilum 20Z]